MAWFDFIPTAETAPETAPDSTAEWQAYFQRLNRRFGALGEEPARLQGGMGGGYSQKNGSNYGGSTFIDDMSSPVAPYDSSIPEGGTDWAGYTQIPQNVGFTGGSLQLPQPRTPNTFALEEDELAAILGPGRT